MATLRPELKDAAPNRFAPDGATAYLAVYEAVKTQRGLIHGRIHQGGESCAIGSFFDVHPDWAFHSKLIDEIAAVNDSVPAMTKGQRKRFVMRWLRWRLAQFGVPGFQPRKSRKRS